MAHVECASSHSHLTSPKLGPKSYVEEKIDTIPPTKSSPNAENGAMNQRSEMPGSLEVSGSDNKHEAQDTAQVYPASWKFLVIMVGLMLSCILVALVGQRTVWEGFYCFFFSFFF